MVLESSHLLTALHNRRSVSPGPEIVQILETSYRAATQPGIQQQKIRTPVGHRDRRVRAMVLKTSIVIAIAAVVLWFALLRTGNKASSVIFLAMNYLARPHTDLQVGQYFEPIDLPSAWNGSYLSKHSELWIYELTDADKAAVREGVEHFQSLNKTMNEMTLDDFPLTPDFLNKVKDWKNALGGYGRGFQVIRGVPVHEWTLKQSEIFFFALGKYLGKPGAQDVEGSLLGHVINMGETGKVERPYRKSVDIAYHCDGADVVGLLCMQPAKSGGASRIISSVTVHNELLKHPRGQDYIRRLYGKVLLFTRKTFGLSPYLPVYPFRRDGHGVLRSYWNQEFYVKSYRHVENGTLTDQGRADPFVLEAVEAYDAILSRDIARAQAREARLLARSMITSSDAAPDGTLDGSTSQDSPTAEQPGEEGNSDGSDSSNWVGAEGAGEDELGLSMYLQRGDVQLVSNHFVLHARTEFTDYTDAEIAQAAVAAGVNGPDQLGPIGKRELLRLWLSHPTSEMTWSEYLGKQVELLRVLAAVAEGVIKYAF